MQHPNAGRNIQHLSTFGFKICSVSDCYAARQDVGQFVFLKPEEVHHGKPRYVPIKLGGTEQPQKVLYDRRNPTK